MELLKSQHCSYTHRPTVCTYINWRTWQKLTGVNRTL